ncbi:hypothetical protein RFI_08550 [Reticulomyxa filosa]|uniref:Transmembrane protein n=1 Tax=Reticulomyxa filosa TaxID=46433 RepID=X6NTE7_RETFI|nr:hypothetical protein RFI_08550 [Reticulomyxa filosa]|eukprot:ETO28582.1 hypothetical protein RFI_08550 [Reticulomyxa filosa]
MLTGGRDKFTKWLQYASKLLAYLLVTGKHKEYAQRLNDLAADLSQCRKGFRLLKSLNEVDRFSAFLEMNEELALKVLRKEEKRSKGEHLFFLSPLLSLGMALFYGVYWYYDAKVYLAKAKFLTNAPAAALNVTAGKWWFGGLLCQLIISILMIKRYRDTSFKHISDTFFFFLKKNEEADDEDTSKTDANLKSEYFSLSIFFLLLFRCFLFLVVKKIFDWFADLSRCWVILWFA